MKSHPLPKRLHIGYQDIAVKMYDLEDAQGMYIPDRPEIRIKESLEGREILNTLLHECLHAAIYVYGLKSEFKDDDHEEKVVNALGNAFTELCLRNPSLLLWMKACG